MLGKERVHEKMKNSSNVNKDQGSIKKTINRLADGLIAGRPSDPTATAPTQAADPDLERKVMAQLIATEVDHVMSVHRAYISDLARRSRINHRMCKHLKRELKHSNRNANTGVNETESSDSSSNDCGSSEEECGCGCSDLFVCLALRLALHCSVQEMLLGLRNRLSSTVIGPALCMRDAVG